jgi:RNA polymerase sigma-70 factor (ECF subfamily)
LLSDEDQQFVARGLPLGDRGAWARLYDGYSLDVWRYVSRLVGSDSAAVADIVQETFLAAARSAHGFDPGRGTLWTWVIGIAHRQVAIYWRADERATRWRKLVESGGLDARRWLDEETSQVLVAERRETAEMVRGVLAELSVEYSLLLAGKYIDQLSLEQLAEQLASTTEAVKSKLARARREFRRQFERRVGADTTARLP